MAGICWPKADPTSPFFCHGPSLISFSGGRTSAFMLWCVLCAHGGVLPGYVHVTFANTGKEREETLRFVHECATRWGVRVRWLEWRTRRTKDDDGTPIPFDQRFEEVGFNSASRDGKPFADLIAVKGYTPNAVTRFCTSELKVRIMGWFMQAQGYTHWTNIVGLRHDEQHRVRKSRAPNNERWTTALPLDDAKVSNRDVRAFWAEQDFDLQLLPFEGNCDGCFLKARPKLWETERTAPGTLQWWADQERLVEVRAAARLGPFRKATWRFDDDGRVFDGWELSWPSAGRFVTEFSYNELIRDVRQQPDMFAGGLFDFDPDMDAECGLWCEGEAA